MQIKDCMNMMEITINRDSSINAIIKWTGLFVFLTFCASGLISLHQYQSEKLIFESELLKQKSLLVTQMHNEMLLISRTQLELLHASNEQQVKTKLVSLSALIADHLIHYHQLKKIADESDTVLLNKFKLGFEKWQGFNQDLLTYATIISDPGFIYTLNKVDLAISQLDENETQLLITQLKNNKNTEYLSN